MVKKHCWSLVRRPIMADGKIASREAELIRAVADTIGCPLPPSIYDGTVELRASPPRGRRDSPKWRLTNAASLMILIAMKPNALRGAVAVLFSSQLIGAYLLGRGAGERAAVADAARSREPRTVERLRGARFRRSDLGLRPAGRRQVGEQRTRDGQPEAECEVDHRPGSREDAGRDDERQRHDARTGNARRDQGRADR